MYELIILVIFGHLLGDFVFQTNQMVENINQKKLKSPSLYVHVSIHFILLIILTGFKKEYIFPSILLAISHLTIDCLTKIYLKNKMNTILNFILDQTLHLITIGIYLNHFFPLNLKLGQIFSSKNQLLCVALICLTIVSSIIIKKLMEVLHLQTSPTGLKDAGKYIGMLERLFIFLFVVTNFWEGIGFLLAAKSIFRFGDLKESNDVKLTEYILIGTLLSFGLAIFVGMTYLKIIAFI